MDKSYNDISAQAQRILSHPMVAYHFQGCNNRLHESLVHKLEAETRAQHGISVFCLDKDKKYPCIRPYENKFITRKAWWQTDEWIETEKRLQAEADKRRAEYAAKKKAQDPCDGMSIGERIEWVVGRMHQSSVREFRLRILDIMKRSISFGVEAQNYGEDALQLVKLVYADSKRILDHYNETHKGSNAYELSLF